MRKMCKRILLSWWRRFLFCKFSACFRFGFWKRKNSGFIFLFSFLVISSKICAPGGSGRLPVSSVSVSCGKGSRPACALWAAAVYMGSLSCVPSIFPLPFSLKRLPVPFLRRVPALARSPDFGTFCPEVVRCGASPAGVFLFGRSFIFQGAAHR